MSAALCLMAWKRGDRPAELHADLGVLDGQLERPLARAHQLGAQRHRRVVDDAAPQARCGRRRDRPARRRVARAPGARPCAVGSSVGTASPAGASTQERRRCRRRCAPTTSTQSAVWPSSTSGFSPVTSHCAALRWARRATRARGRLIRPPRARPCRGPRRRRACEQVVEPEAARGERCEHRRGEERPGQRQPAHLLLHDDQVDQAGARDRRAPRARAGRPSRPMPTVVGEAALVVDHRADVGRRRLLGQEAPGALPQRVLLGAEREIHGGGRYALTVRLRGRDGLRLHTGGRGVPRRAAGWLDENLPKFFAEYGEDGEVAATPAAPGSWVRWSAAAPGSAG